MNIRPDIPIGYTYNEQGQILTYKSSSGYWYEYTYDNQGRYLTYKSSNSIWHEYFYDLCVYAADVGVYRIYE